MIVRRPRSRDVRHGWLAGNWQYLLLIVVAAAVSFLVALALSRPVPPAEPREPGPVRSQDSTPIPAPTPSPSPPPSPSPTGTPTVVAFIGDSYTFGSGATRTERRWTSLLAASYSLTEINLGSEDTGYATGDVPFSARIEETIAARPDVVIISGGRFDYSGSSTAESVSAAIVETFSALRTGLPDAQIFAIGPIWDASAAPTRLAEIADQIRGAVTAADGTYLDIGQPLAGKPGLLAADGILPNDAGYAELVASIDASIAPLIATGN